MYSELSCDLADLTPDKVDFSQIDRWLVNVPCPWRIDESARVALYWNSRPSKNKESRVFCKPPFPFQSLLSESDRDEIVLYENGIDTHQFFKIDFSDYEEAEKTEIETVTREIEENLRKLQSMNLSTYATTIETVTAIEEKPVETRTEAEKQVLDIFSKVLGLRKRREVLTLRLRTSKYYPYVEST